MPFLSNHLQKENPLISPDISAIRKVLCKNFHFLVWMGTLFSTALLFFLIGSAAGFLGGMFGIGGGIIAVPLLIWSFQALQTSPTVLVHLALGTSLGIIVFTSTSSALSHWRRGNVNWREAFYLIITGIPGAVLGSSLSAFTPGDLLKRLFGLVLLLGGGILWMLPQGTGKRRFSLPSSSILLLSGFLAGILSAYFGVGGGLLAVPLMTLVVGIPIHRAVGNSSSFIVPIAITGVVGYIYHGWQKEGLPPHTVGYLHLVAWLWAGLASVVFANVGARVATRTKPVRLKKAFALLLFLVGIRFIIGAW